MTDTEIKNIFPEELKINPEKGFDEHDIFGWKHQGEGLIDLLNSTNQQMVIGLDSPWGSGKTTFLQMLAGELKKTNGKNSVIYFDAFEVDYMDDPFIAFAGELSAHIENLTSLDEKIKDKFTKSLTQVGKGLFKRLIKVGVKAATLNSIDIDEVEEDIANEFAKSATSILDQEVESSIKAYQEKKAAVNELKSSLSQIAEDLTEGDKSLIFIIDELDRCRPDFALRILEQIKHLFSTPNVHFIMSADYKQLRAMVKKAYGNEYDSEKYFHKFIQNSISLKHEDPVPKYLKLFCQGTNLNSISHGDDSYLLSYLTALHKKHSISIREMQRILIILSSTHKTHQIRQFSNGMMVGLAAMKVINIDLFLKASRGELGRNEFEEFFGVNCSNTQTAHPEVFLQIWVSIYFNLLFENHLDQYYREEFSKWKRGCNFTQERGLENIVEICRQFMNFA